MVAIRRYTQEMIDAYVAAGHWGSDLTVDYWYRNAQTRPDAIAVADDHAFYTWAEGVRAVDGIAAGLIAAGVPRDGVLLVQAPNSALLVLFRLACEIAGVIPAFLHTGSRRSEIEVVAKRVHPVGAVFATDAKADLLPLYDAVRSRLEPGALFTLAPNGAGIRSIAELTRLPPGTHARRMRPYEMTGIVTSSGTTGVPKCIEYSCWPRLASGRVYIERLQISMADVVLTCVPFYTGGGDMQFHATPQAGARLIVLPQFAPESTCALIEREGVTGAVMVPTMIARIGRLADQDRYDLSTLRWVVSSGGPLAYDVGAQFEAVTRAKIIQGYGLMDYGALASHSIDDPRETRLRSSGRPMPGTELHVVDADGLPLPRGAIGEICARGPHCNGGYIGDPDATTAAWPDGFFRTGDLGRLAEGGYVVLEGRSKDIIIRGGQNISATEVESILCGHPAIADVAVVRTPDKDMGERACAFVVLRPGQRLAFGEMVSFMKSRDVATYKIPERLEIVAELPITVSGTKVDKRALEARLHAAEAGVQHR